VGIYICQKFPLHDIEPYYNWRHQYTAEEDERSPFFGRQYSEFEFSNTVYNYYIHPQWDDMGSKTLYVKLLLTDYEDGYAIIELLGEWNDVIENDIQTLKRNVIDLLIANRISKFILIGENVLNFHFDCTDYYEEWLEDIQEDGGWITVLNLSEHVAFDFLKGKLNRYLTIIREDHWRTLKPEHLFQKVESLLSAQLE
jgi:hypothetical protein